MRKPIHSISLLFALFFTIHSLFGQNHQKQGGQGDRIQSHKIAFLTDRLDLTPEEATRFWPVYNEFSKKKQKIQKDIREIIKAIHMPEGQLSSEKMEALGDRLIKIKVSEASLAEQYHKRFKTVLPPEKIIRLYAAEEQFKKHLLKMVRNQKHNSPKGHPKNRN